MAIFRLHELAAVFDGAVEEGAMPVFFAFLSLEESRQAPYIPSVLLAAKRALPESAK